jgi:ribosomal protein S27AE
MIYWPFLDLGSWDLELDWVLGFWDLVIRRAAETFTRPRGRVTGAKAFGFSLTVSTAKRILSMVRTFQEKEIRMSYENKCARCGGINLEPGHLHTTGRVHFRPSHAKFLTLHTADVELKAEVCTDCGHVQMVADTKKLATILDHAKPAVAAV